MLYTLNAVNDFINKYYKYINDIKITHFDRFDFNEMEGYQYRINFKIITADKYRNKLVKVLTNSTYLECYGTNNKEIKENLLISLLP